MAAPRVVIDTNVLVSALRSRRGASFRLLSLVGMGYFEVAVSVPLILEYEDVLSRPECEVPLSAGEISNVLDYVCSVARHYEVYFLWRPLLRDPKDDMVLELAVTSQSQVIITFNTRDFREAESFGVRLVTPREFLLEIGEIQ